MACGTCGQNECDGTDESLVCLGLQIEQVKNRTDQLKAQIEELNTGEPFDALCPVQECRLPDCPNTGSICSGSPTGRSVGQTDPCCSANPPNLGDFCDELSNLVKKNSRKLTKLEQQVCDLRNTSLTRILLDTSGKVRGGVTVGGKVVSFSSGTWEQMTS